MLEYLDRNIDLRTLFWSFPAVVLMHNSEEILTFERFWRENRDSLPIPAAIKDRIEVTTPQIAATVLCIFAIVLPASYLAAKSPRVGGARLEFFNAMVGALFLDALQHASQTLMIRKYTPGVVTAGTVSLPYSVYVFYRLRGEELIDWYDLRRSVKIGGLAVIPIVLCAHAVGRLLARWF